MHQVQDSLHGLRSSNLSVFRRNRGEVLELLLKSLQAVFFVAVRDGPRLKQVEVAAVDEAYDLDARDQNSSLPPD